MESEIIKFAERIEERKNSARAKLSILVYGIQDAPEIFSDLEGNFKEEHYAYDNGNWGISKSRLVPTEMLLPGDIIVKLHIRPDSPLTLTKEEGRIFVKNGTRYLTLMQKSLWTTRKLRFPGKIRKIFSKAHKRISLYMTMKASWHTRTMTKQTTLSLLLPALLRLT